MQGCYRPSRKSANGGKGRRTALYFTSTIGGFLGFAVVGAGWVLRQQCRGLPTVAASSSETAGSCISELTLSTLNRQTSQIAGWRVVSGKRSLALRFQTAALGMSSQLPFALITGAVGCDEARVESELKRCQTDHKPADPTRGRLRAKA